MTKKGNRVLSMLMGAGYEAYFVGGCVRDYFNKMDPNDIDITTNATPDQIQEVFKELSVQLVGVAFGTVVVNLEGESFEVTTYRTEQYTDGSRNPEVKFGTSIEEDLARRDFTMNAMAMGLNGEDSLIDPFDGLCDLRYGRLVFVGDANERIKEDPLRILRAIRFMSKYNYTIDINGEHAIHSNMGLLSTLSKERVSAELTKIFNGGISHYEAYNLLVDGGLMTSLLTPTEWWDYDYPKSFLPEIKKYKLEVNLALLTRSLFDGGAWLKRMKFPNEVVRVVELFIDNMNNPPKDIVELKKLMVAFDKDKEALDSYVRLLSFTQKKDFAFMYDTMLHVYDEPMRLSELALNGTDLVTLGYEGERIGVTLEVLMDLVREHPEYNTRESLLKVLPPHKT